MNVEFSFNFRDSKSFFEYMRLNFDSFLTDKSTLLITFDGDDIFKVIVSELDL